ncbi:MAG: hypothetical protein R3C49_27480 [Planctomycetaceae bacterium]
MTRILTEIESLPDFDTEFHSLLRDELNRADLSRQQSLAQVAARLQQIDREEQNLTDAIRRSGYLPAMERSMRELQAEREQLAIEQDELTERGCSSAVAPSMSEVRRLAHEAIADLTPTSAEFGRQIRRIVTRLIAVPFRLIDGARVELRAFIEIDLSGFAGTPLLAGMAPTRFRRRLIVDLFDAPMRFSSPMRWWG